jgi:hypothetical protein
MTHIDPNRECRLLFTAARCSVQCWRLSLGSKSVSAVSLWNGFLRLVLVGLCANTDVVCADQNVPPSDKDVGETSRVLVLKSWQVVTGQIRPRGDGYVINHQTGRMFVGSSQIWIMATDLADAHQKMKESLQTITPDVNMRLAAWCSRQQMWGTAKQELLDALHQDPFRDEAKKMLAKVIRAQEAAAAPSGEPVSHAVDSSRETGLALPRRALGGLTTELARDFSGKIQPLLSNRCGSCHQANSGRQFVLQALSRNKSFSSVVSEQNLAAVIGQLDPADVPKSPLLVYSMKPHGGAKTAPFHGRLALEYKKRLNQWSVDAITALGQEATGRASAIAARTNQLRRVPRQSPVSDREVTLAEYVVGDDTPHGIRRQQGQVDSGQLEDAARRNRIDPFNPEIFNQRHRGRSVSTDAFSRRRARRSP